VGIRAHLGYGFIPRNARDGLALIERAEAAGFDTVWTVMPALGRDTPTLYAAAALRTDRIKLGTAIVPAFTRHPLALATQMLTLEDLAPGRIRLGIGTAHQYAMIPAYGLPFTRPLTQLREYLQVLKPALQTGTVSFSGEFYRSEGALNDTPGTPVLISALREHAFETAGELADGVITWLCPIDYVERVGAPALARGAQRADRETPSLVVHVPVVPRRNRDAAVALMGEMASDYADAVFYRRMFADAGFPFAEGERPPRALLETLVVSGDADDIRAGLEARLARGATDLLLNIPPSDDLAADQEALFEIVSGLE
jgi:alkanesulfonate monooxygenase SsuD/methylene tetrahydromethanopterin reductase-like flavin-dependent oxidoreductase (luciferase family)